MEPVSIKFTVETLSIIFVKNSFNYFGKLKSFQLGIMNQSSVQLRGSATKIF